MNKAWEQMSREQLYKLLENSAKNWLAMDGLWFQSFERNYGMDKAMECDVAVWEKFTIIEARRIKEFLGLPDRCGLEGLKAALNLRNYSSMNEDEYILEGNTLKYRILDCRVQHARLKKGMEMHPCKVVGITEYAGFAKFLDDRISCECVSCYPDITEQDCSCSWLFTLNE